MNTLLEDGKQATISKARAGSKSFGSGNRVDTVDLVNFADNLKSDEGTALSKAIKGAVKYNKTSSMITNAYGISIYFPKETMTSVSTMTNTYDKIGIDNTYSKALQSYAKVSGTAQSSYGGSTNTTTLFDMLSGGSSSTANPTAQMLSQLATAFLQGQLSSSNTGFTSANTSWLRTAPISDDTVIQTIEDNHVDTSKLVFEQDDDGKYKLDIDDDTWNLINDVRLKKFYDDGEGYLELSKDNDYEWDGDKLVAQTDRNWVTINGQSVAYYYIGTEEYSNDKYQITGRVPCLINGVKSNLIVIYSNEFPKGNVVGATTDTNITTVPKNMTHVNSGDKIDFITDYYSNSGKYLNTYKLGNQISVTSALKVSNALPGNGKQKILYKFTDVYNQPHYSKPIIK